MTNRRRAEYWLDQLFRHFKFDWGKIDEDPVTYALDQFESLDDPWVAQVLAAMPRAELRAMIAERIEKQSQAVKPNAVAKRLRP